MKIKKIATGIAALATTFALAACGSSAPDADSGDTGNAADQTGTVRVWFMEGSISEDAQAYLTEEFKKQNPDADIAVEIQQWDGIVSKLQTSLASKNESPDLVEIGNTQTTTFTTIGALADVTDMKETLGGDALIPSFVDSSTVDGKIYAYPLYAGARGVFYRTDLLEQAGIEVPTTIDEFTQAAIDLQAANPEGVDGFSGLYLAAVDPHGVESYLFAQGFEYAQQEGDKWVGKTSSPDSIAALSNAQKVFKEGTQYALDSQQGQKSFERYFNEGKVGMLIGTGNIGVKIDQQMWDDGKVGVFAIPSKTPGEPGATFAGGSNIAMAKNAPYPELAKSALEIIFSEGFQTKLAADGWVPGNTSYGDAVSGPFGDIAADIINNSKLTPNSPEWGVNYGATELNEFFTRIAKGEDVNQVASAFDAELDSTLNK
ncbi:MAG: extracellular solute-binding protein [Actinomycetaceae bacterium]|nr:extracellular solute-binding protein [Actinomycetaceae bacterium]